MSTFYSENEKFLSFLKKIEKKWQRSWLKSKAFEANPSKKKKFFLTFPIPYVNGAPHIGHSFSSFRADSFVRFKRLEGFNVLFPQGFHATGEPILGAIERIKNNDETQIKTFKLYGATDEDLKKFVEKGPEWTAKYWMKKWIEVLKMAGFSIDWRRTFITAITPQFNKFIEWQYNTLRRKGYVTQGTHPVIWCPHCQSPTGDHDRLKGEGESPIEFVLIKFKLPSGEVLPCATLRPETVYGVTNIWIKPDGNYVWVELNNEVWLVSEPTVLKLKDQLRKVKVIGKIKGEKLLGKEVINPITGKKVPILPASFIDLHVGTGIVMSVPAHAPYDFIALEDLKKDPKIKSKYNLEHINPVPIIKTEGLGEIPAKEICEKLGINSQSEKEKLDEATEEIYKKEYHLGVLTIGEFKGKKVSEIKETLIKKYKLEGKFDSIWETTDVVICRCGTRCHVKILENQWFLRYSDEKWKEKVRTLVKRMSFYPEEIRKQFLNTVEWLKDKACTRRTGLGTLLPWDKSWKIETLSDSTIYMAYYTISHLIKKYKIKSNQLTDEVFDFIFLGKGNPKKISKKLRIPLRALKEMRKEFEYFYPVDLRSSGKDLVQNHLTFYLFHHTAIWPKKYWPKAIAVNGFVQVAGQKMSKSKGNIIPLKKLIEKYGSDLVRINIISSNEGLDDADWREENIHSFVSRIKMLFNLVDTIKKSKKRKLSNVDKFIISRMEEAVEKSRKLYQELRFRSATQLLIYSVLNDFEWYLQRTKVNKAIKPSFEKYIKAISPLLPHISEELWKRLGKKGFVFQGGWPKKGKTYKDSVEGELFIKKVIEDINEIKKIVGVAPREIYLIVAPDWKFKVYTSLKKGEVEISSFEKELRGKVAKYVQILKKKRKEIALPPKKQLKLLKEASDLIEKRFGAKVFVLRYEETDLAKRENADVDKPAIYLK